MEQVRKISDKHREFIRLVAGGMPQVDAYKVTVGNGKVSSNVARVKGSQVAKRYAKEIETEREKARSMIEAVNNSDAVKQALNNVLTQAQVDAKICSIITGELEVERIVVTQSGIKKVMERPSQSDILRAADIYYKRFGSYAKQEVDVTSGGDKLPTQTIIKWGDKEIAV